ncbi:hypothetical protein [Novosphingobium aquae]|uniref:Uncharacterized protein n=1 Tax=Novosphingobium aquae TaxID=3133435 RepID=A0ABU8S5E9_9SPHN
MGAASVAAEIVKADAVESDAFEKLAKPPHREQLQRQQMMPLEAGAIVLTARKRSSSVLVSTGIDWPVTQMLLPIS